MILINIYLIYKIYYQYMIIIDYIWSLSIIYINFPITFQKLSYFLIVGTFFCEKNRYLKKPWKKVLKNGFYRFWPRRIHSPGSMVHAVSRSRVCVCLSVCVCVSVSNPQIYKVSQVSRLRVGYNTETKKNTSPKKKKKKIYWP